MIEYIVNTLVFLLLIIMMGDVMATILVEWCGCNVTVRTSDIYSRNFAFEESNELLAFGLIFNILRHQLSAKMTVKKPLKPDITWIQKQDTDSYWSWYADNACMHIWRGRQ